MQRPTATQGLHHIALFCQHFTACEQFYCELIGMHVEWRPDADNVYLTSGNDNLALHRAPNDFTLGSHEHLDHIGFILAEPEQVDEWYDFFKKNNVTLHSEVKSHRDGARSFYCADPDGNAIQFIYHPPLKDKYR